MLFSSYVSTFILILSPLKLLYLHTTPLRIVTKFRIYVYSLSSWIFNNFVSVTSGPLEQNERFSVYELLWSSNCNRLCDFINFNWKTSIFWNSFTRVCLYVSCVITIVTLKVMTMNIFAFKILNTYPQFVTHKMNAIIINTVFYRVKETCFQESWPRMNNYALTEGLLISEIGRTLGAL